MSQGHLMSSCPGAPYMCVGIVTIRAPGLRFAVLRQAPSSRPRQSIALGPYGSPFRSF